jgi:serine/threonine-protein kinase
VANESAREAPAQLDSQRYRVIDTLGRGGMAVVYEAVDTVDSRRVALKRLQPNAAASAQQRNLESFEREFHTLKQLAHPQVVEVYDFCADAGGAYYTMELLSGGDLQELAPLPWRTACAIARDMCAALSLLHSRRLVHRDISPRNVRCDSAGRPKLIDFGAVAPPGPTKLLIGTPP